MTSRLEFCWSRLSWQQNESSRKLSFDGSSSTATVELTAWEGNIYGTLMGNPGRLNWSCRRASIKLIVGRENNRGNLIFDIECSEEKHNFVSIWERIRNQTSSTNWMDVLACEIGIPASLESANSNLESLPRTEPDLLPIMGNSSLTRLFR